MSSKRSAAETFALFVFLMKFMYLLYLFPCMPLSSRCEIIWSQFLVRHLTLNKHTIQFLDHFVFQSFVCCKVSAVEERLKVLLTIFARFLSTGYKTKVSFSFITFWSWTHRSHLNGLLAVKSNNYPAKIAMDAET